MFRSIYPQHFDVKDIHIRIYIIFYENFTQKTIYTASIYFLQGNRTAARVPRHTFSMAILKFSILEYGILVLHLAWPYYILDLVPG